jgi:hypothetical protein
MKTTLKIAAALVACSLGSVASAATLVLVNVDPPGIGFNDPRPATPVGGNTGTTVGQQRLIAFQRALDLWGSVLKSDVPVLVEGSFAPQQCTATGGVLASAGPFYVFRDFPNAPRPATWYPIAIASALAGEDLVPEDTDLGAFFNGNVGQPNCIAGGGWYYGLDSNPGPGQIDFLDTFMHEVSHGLGFTYFASRTTGALFLGFPDHYTTYLRDLSTGKGWNEMTSAERLTSRLNDSNLVWTGPSATGNAPRVLGPRRYLSAYLHGSSKLTFFKGTSADFGSVADENFYGTAELVNDGAGVSTADACEPIPAGNYKDKVAVVDRGTCAFLVKAANIQAAGFCGMVLVNNVAVADGFTANVGGLDPSITIPVLGIGLADGNTLKASLPTWVRAVRRSRAELEGAKGIATTGPQYPQLYAPTVFAGGSSVAHFDQRHAPNALMEPAITATLRGIENLDLTPFLFQDTGWQLQNLSIGSCQTTAPSVNRAGEILSVKVESCAADSETSGQFVACIAGRVYDDVKAGLLTAGQASSVVSCAAKASDK